MVVTHGKILRSPAADVVSASRDHGHAAASAVRRLNSVAASRQSAVNQGKDGAPARRRYATWMQPPRLVQRAAPNGSTVTPVGNAGRTDRTVRQN
jgi:hypothetical protein